MDFVGIDGAIQTIEKLLKNAEKRAAAITTLGKTVERCRAKLGAANPAFLASLFNVLDGVSEAAFQYDIEWINNNMQRTRQQQGRACDGVGPDGRVQKTIDSPGMYVCCLDVELANQLVLMCGIYDPPVRSFKSRIAVYDGRPNQDFAGRGDIMRQEVDMTAVVRALPGTPNLITGESVRLPNNAFQEQISLYDLNRVMNSGSAGAAIDPVMKFQDHKNLVTCLAPIGLSNPGVFVSGSRDFTVKLWDIRSGPTAVATMGVQANDFASTTHAEMVTCVDVSADGALVLSGSLDQSMAAWDMRSLGTRPLATAGPGSVCNHHGTQTQWNNSGILKACLEGSPLDKLAAVATVQGLYTVDFSGAVPIITAANAVQADGVTPKQYNDIKWASKPAGCMLQRAIAWPLMCWRSRHKQQRPLALAMALCPGSSCCGSGGRCCC
ncbi:hypothetical protein COO60DRAFT_1623946 [Scenedesmus sp. NREL 46B-D3]|nr:hypothetical protein COO60DRAFT_1623946 [Scenedesmus sp. NREL 46B-D3]